MDYLKDNEEVLRKIVDRYFGDLNFISCDYISSGIMNSVYELKFENISYILKICTSEYKDNLKRSVRFLEFVKEQVDYLPNVICYNFTKDVVNNDFVVFEKIDGYMLDNIYSKLNVDQKRNIYFQLGSFLGKLNSIRFTKFNDFVNGEYDSYKEKLKNDFHSCIDRIKDVRLIELNVKLKNIFDYFVEKEEMNIASLCHMDMNKENVIVKNGEVVGIIDFEWSEIGFAEYDYFFAMKYLSKDKNDLKIFRKAYLEKNIIGDGYNRRLVIYNIYSLIISMLCINKVENSNEAYIKCVRKAEEIIEEYYKKIKIN